jgi:hypothetical protein
VGFFYVKNKSLIMPNLWSTRTISTKRLWQSKEAPTLTEAPTPTEAPTLQLAEDPIIRDSFCGVKDYVDLTIM